MRPAQKTAWFSALAQEATRDLVFAWNIGRGSFGGLAEHEQVPLGLFIEAVQHLLAAGCRVGFGDPDSASWRELIASDDRDDEKAKIIGELWQSSPKEHAFLVFAIRPRTRLA